ncbi:putative P-loop containing nucleoside triphosphate hydrolase, leucine-rich repeat domain superfamily [Helianthus annuus]|nr:putative P-loop containing nucleoside triphosphate hydrolase, leucine-rich repeat domain superfamily [Helianthus annuus]
MDAIVSAVIDGAKIMFKFTWSRIKTLSKCGKNILELREQFGNLMDKKLLIEEDITLAKMEGKTPKPQVIEWLMKVSQAEDVVRPLLEMPNKMMLRYRKCWRLSKKLDLVKELNSIHFETVATERSSPINSVVEIAVSPLVGQGAASNMKRLLEILNKDDNRRIAVWGEGGIGKTALIMNLNNELCISSTNSFDLVIWVQVSRSSDLSTIQSQIAKRIHLKVEAGDTTNSIASRILQRLRLRRKILLILDDVWEKIDLDAVGIPSREPFCKILLTTRSRDVCRHMAVDFSFQVNLMSEEDSWNLFAESVGAVVHSDGIESLARKMAASCHGLPLAIKTLGNSMRDVSQVELWENACLRWQSSSPLFNNINQEVYQHLALSYHSLPSKDLKQCFLYCSLYPESVSINVGELIQCWVSDGLIIGNQTVEQTFNYGIALVERLKNLGLLDHDAAVGTVKLHGIVRELAIRLSKSEELFGFQSQCNSPSYQMPNKSSKRVSLVRCGITKLPVFPLYSLLTVLFLQDNPIKDIPNEFFHNLKYLRVLNLSKTQITSLPSSLLCLSELRSLFLRDCSIEKLPSLKSLGKLLVLDLSRTQIKALPEGLGSLHSLRELDLSCTHFLERIIAGSISGLSSLETLNMSCSAFSWNPKMGHAAAQRATFEELSSLDHLSALQIRLDTVECLAHASCWLMKLKRFDIQISPWTQDPNYHIAKDNEKRLGLRGVNLLQEDFKDFLHNINSLDVLTCVGLTRRHLLSLSSLISLTISNCNDISCLISKERSSKEMFPNLKHLVLDHLQSLETIVEGIIRRGVCLRKLTTIQVLDCPMLKVAVSYAMLRHVKSLEEVKVSGCKNMSCIIYSGEHQETVPNLRVLEMNNMANLRSICDGTSVCPALQRIEVSSCPELKELPLSISNICSLKEIKGEIKWWNNLRWDDDDAKNMFLQYFQVCPGENYSCMKE